MADPRPLPFICPRCGGSWLTWLRRCATCGWFVGWGLLRDMEWPDTDEPVVVLGHVYERDDFDGAADDRLPAEEADLIHAEEYANSEHEDYRDG